MSCWRRGWTAAGLTGTLLALAALLGACGSGEAMAPQTQGADAPPGVRVWFNETASAAGLSFRHAAGGRDKRQIYEANSGGVAWLDYDGDGHLDAYLVGGARTLAGSLAPGAPPAGALFRNTGDGRFVDVTLAAGLADGRWGMGVAVADYDNDGDPDLYVTHLGPNALWRNNGDGTFTDVGADAGVNDAGPGSGAAFGDLDQDGFLDLYVANYIPVDPGHPLPTDEELCTYRNVPVFCGPRGLPPAPDRLYRNLGNGRFADVTAVSGAGSVSPRYSFDVIFLDVEGDGDADIYVAADDMPSLLFINDGTGKLEERGLLAGLALSEAGIAQAGMGVDAADYDGDGLTDVVKTNYESEPYNLYRNDASGLFSDRAFHAGLAATVPPLGFGVVFLDADRDGLLDLYFANGHVYSWTGPPPGPFPYAQLNQLFLGEEEGGSVRFREVTAAAGPGREVRKVSRGVAVGDYDGDGDLDLLVNNVDDAPDLLRNDTPSSGGWLAVRTRGTASNRDGYGAQVILEAGGRRQVREVRASRGFLSSSDPAVFFGLGGATSVSRLEVRWPSGRHETFPVEGINRRLRVVEGEGAPRR